MAGSVPPYHHHYHHHPLVSLPPILSFHYHPTPFASPSSLPFFYISSFLIPYLFHSSLPTLFLYFFTFFLPFLPFPSPFKISPSQPFSTLFFANSLLPSLIPSVNPPPLVNPLYPLVSAAHQYLPLISHSFPLDPHPFITLHNLLTISPHH